jgi:hypothetical protein
LERFIEHLFFSVGGLPFFGLAATYGGGGSVQLLGPDAESTNFTIKVNTSGVDPLKDHTAKTKYRYFETNVPRNGISGSQSQFPHSCVCERFLYSHGRSAYSAGGNM